MSFVPFTCSSDHLDEHTEHLGQMMWFFPRVATLVVMMGLIYESKTNRHPYRQSFKSHRQTLYSNQLCSRSSSSSRKRYRLRLGPQLLFVFFAGPAVSSCFRRFSIALSIKTNMKTATRVSELARNIGISHRDCPVGRFIMLVHIIIFISYVLRNNCMLYSLACGLSLSPLTAFHMANP